MTAIEQIKGVPWNLSGVEGAPEVVFRDVDPDAADGPLPAPRPEMPAPRRLKIMRADLDEHGFTRGCPGCDAQISSRRSGTRLVTRSHSEECRGGYWKRSGRPQKAADVLMRPWSACLSTSAGKVLSIRHRNLRSRPQLHLQLRPRRRRMRSLKMRPHKLRPFKITRPRLRGCGENELDDRLHGMQRHQQQPQPHRATEVLKY